MFWGRRWWRKGWCWCLQYLALKSRKITLTLACCFSSTPSTLPLPTLIWQFLSFFSPFARSGALANFPSFNCWTLFFPFQLKVLVYEWNSRSFGPPPAEWKKRGIKGRRIFFFTFFPNLEIKNLPACQNWKGKSELSALQPESSMLPHTYTIKLSIGVGGRGELIGCRRQRLMQLRWISEVVVHP